MRESDSRGHLKLVPAPGLDTRDEGRPVQGVLFPYSAPRVLCVVHMPGVSQDVFLSTVRSLQPSLVFDLRSVPSFNIGTLNRHVAFEFFEQQGAQYFDVPGMVGAVSRRETKLKAAAIGEAIVHA